MAHFPQSLSFTGFNTPSRIEADVFDLVHEGTIPPELNGAFYRVQPDPQFPPRLGDDISFNGDGMIARFHFHDGQCDFRQRWAHTDKWKLEHAAGKAAPARVRGGHRISRLGREQHRQTVRGENCADTAWPSRHGAVRCGRGIRHVQVLDLRAVHLREPRGLRRQLGRHAQPPAILGDGGREIADMRAYVQGFIGSGADPTVSQRR